MKKIRKHRNDYSQLRAIAEQQLIGFRKKAEGILKRECKFLRKRFATKDALNKVADDLEKADADQTQVLQDFMGLVDERFEAIELRDQV